MNTILLATGNAGKFREMAAVLSSECGESAECGARVRFISLGDLPATPREPIEDGDTFAANARLKAMHYSRSAGCRAIADDSGLEVDVLDGRPGVVSARFAGVDPARGRAAVDLANNRKLIEALRGVPAERRTARFRCALALADGDCILAEADGALEGRIIDEPRGANGFGYDPHFYIEHLGRTAAELSADEKNRISHRGQAVRALAAALRELAGAE